MPVAEEFNFAAAFEAAPRELLQAVAAGNAAAVKELLAGGANPDAVTEEHVSVLSQALMDGRLDVAAALIDGGASLNFRNEDGATPLIAAILHGTEAAVTLLIARGADLDMTRAGDGLTPLMVAVTQGKFVQAGALLAAGAGLDAADAAGRTVLDHAKPHRDCAAGLDFYDRLHAAIEAPLRARFAARQDILRRQAPHVKLTP